jgi:hypothetical protein
VADKPGEDLVKSTQAVGRSPAWRRSAISSINATGRNAISMSGKRFPVVARLRVSGLLRSFSGHVHGVNHREFQAVLYG